MIPKLIEYEVRWTKCPTRNNEPQVLFVEAENKKDAHILTEDYIKRNKGISWFNVDLVTESKKMPVGGIVTSERKR